MKRSEGRRLPKKPLSASVCGQSPLLRFKSAIQERLEGVGKNGPFSLTFCQIVALRFAQLSGMPIRCFPKSLHHVNEMLIIPRNELPVLVQAAVPAALKPPANRLP